MTPAPVGVAVGVGAEPRGTGWYRALVLLACAALAGCGAANVPSQSFRDPDAPIAATTRFEPARFEGTYRVVAAFADGTATPAAGPVRYDWDGGAGFAYSEAATGATQYRIVAPGRMAGDGDEHWVLWVDADYRTVAIGTPSGAFGRILERGPNVSPDRMAAAREIFDWFGYDMTKLRKVQQ